MSRAAAAGACAGAALWCSLGVLDRVAAADGIVRVAMLPPWWALIVLIAAGAALAAAGVRAIGGTADRLFASAVLVLPYLPFVADAIPTVMVLAGPGRWIVWIVIVAAQTATRFQNYWIAVEVDRRVPPWLRGGTFCSFVAGSIVLGAIASRVTGTAYFPGGDEPHYLVITQSLLRDGDFKIENNHQRGDYGEYYGAELRPHYLNRGKDGEIYSVHPVGLPVLAVPAFALGGYPAVVALIVLCGAGAGALLWRWVFSLTASAGAAWFSWAATTLSAPFVFNSVTVYPEVPAAFAVLLALSDRRRSQAAPPCVPAPPNVSMNGPSEAATSQTVGGANRASDLLRGIAVATLPWLSTKYAPMSAAILVVLLWRIWRETTNRREAGLRAAMVAAPYVISLAGWFAFFQMIWGTPSPTAPYGNAAMTRLLYLRFGGPGLLFDQEYGIVPYMPVLFAGLTGLAAMLVRRGASRVLALELLVVSGALLAAVGAFQLWWGGSAPPGRPVAAGLLLLGLPLAWQYTAAPRGSGRRAVYHALLVIGLCVTATMAIVGSGALTASDRDGSSTLVEWLSPLWPVWQALPTYLAEAPLGADLRVFLWGAGALIASWLAGRTTAGSPRPLLLIAVTAIVVTTLSTQTIGFRDLDIEGRARVPLLDRYDAAWRPTGIIYDPMRVVPAPLLPPLVTLTASRGVTRPVQPVAVLFNGRFALPAGEYEVAVTTTAAPPPQSLFVGKQGYEGDAVDAWTLALDAPGTWRQRFTLPIDINVLGFGASDAAVDTIDEIRVTPVSIVDRARRPPTQDVTAVERYGAARVYFHDSPAWPEPAGFWTPGRARTRFTIAGTGSLQALRLRAGRGGNVVTIDAPDGRQNLSLTDGETRDVDLRGAGEGPLFVEMTSASGFRPSDVDPGSRDRRLLGVWVELVSR